MYYSGRKNFSKLVNMRSHFWRKFSEAPASSWALKMICSLQWFGLIYRHDLGVCDYRSGFGFEIGFIDTFLIFFYWNCGRWSPYRMSTRRCGHVLAYCTCPGWLWGWRSWWNEMWLAGETEVLGENLLRRHFVHHKSYLPDPGANPGRRDGKPVTNRFSYGAALLTLYTHTTRKYELQALVSLLLISAIHKSLEHILSLLSLLPLVVFW
jgi:hypothetical protein